MPLVQHVLHKHWQLRDATFDCGYEHSPIPDAMQVYVCSAAPMDSVEVVDTTGAGDAFIASVIYGVVQGKSFEDTLKLGTIVAASKCTKLGARPGLPKRSQLAPQFL